MKQYNNTLFKKYPYRGWLIIALLCWSAATVRFYMLRQMATPEAMTKLVSRDFQKRQKALNDFLANETLIDKMFADSLSSEEVDELSKQPFYIYAFRDDIDLIFWNNNTVVGTCNEDFPEKNQNSLYRYNGTFYKQCLHPPFIGADEHLVVLFPLRYRYSFQNNYLQSFFVAADYIPISTSSSDEKRDGGYPVLAANNTPLFYLYFQTEDLPRHIPDIWLSVFFIAAILSTTLWLHLLALAMARLKKHTMD